MYSRKYGILFISPYRQLCSEVLDEERQRLDKKAEVELDERRDRVSIDVCHNIVQEVTQQESVNLATAEMRYVNSIHS